MLLILSYPHPPRLVRKRAYPGALRLPVSAESGRATASLEILKTFRRHHLSEAAASGRPEPEFTRLMTTVTLRERAANLSFTSRFLGPWTFFFSAQSTPSLRIHTSSARLLLRPGETDLPLSTDSEDPTVHTSSALASMESV